MKISGEGVGSSEGRRWADQGRTNASLPWGPRFLKQAACSALHFISAVKAQVRFHVWLDTRVECHVLVVVANDPNSAGPFPSRVGICSVVTVTLPVHNLPSQNTVLVVHDAIE